MRRTATSLAVGAAGLLCACGSAGSTATPTATATPRATATPSPTATPRPPLPDAHQLTFQQADIPTGYRPHPTSIMTLDAKTSVSERLVGDGSVITASGVQSGAEYGWESSSTGRLAVQNALFVCATVDGAHVLWTSIHDTFKAHMQESSDSPHFADDTASFSQGALHVVVIRFGRVVFAVETTSETSANPTELGQQLYTRLTAYDTGSS